MVLVGLCVAVAAAADKDKKAGHKKGKEATITSVDPQKGTLIVKMNDKNGKEVEKTFKLAEDIEYMDSTGKVASVDIFTSGDLVLLVDREGQITKLQKKDKSDSKGKSDSK
jgi:hypothetical protein